MSNLAKGKTYTTPATASGYPDTGSLELTDGIVPIASISDAGWVGFDTGNPVIVINLGSSQTVYTVIVHLFRLAASSITLPSNILVEVGNGAATWTTLGNVVPSGADGVVSQAKVVLLAGLTNQYVRLTFTRSSGTILIGDIAAYNEAFLPLDFGISSEVLGNMPAVDLPSPDINFKGLDTALLLATNGVLTSEILGLMPVLELPDPDLGFIGIENSFLLNVNRESNRVVSQVLTYENGYVTATVELLQTAGLTGWLVRVFRDANGNIIPDTDSKPDLAIGGVVNSLTPKTLHVLRFRAVLANIKQELNTKLEIVN
jgi:hypothetical protein